MKFTSILSFAMDEIIGRIKQFLLIITVFSIGIVLLGISIYLYESTSFYEKISDGSLTYGNEGTYYCDSQSLSEHTLTDNDLLNKLRKVDGIEYSGAFGLSEISVVQGKGLEQIRDLQKGSRYATTEGTTTDDTTKDDTIQGISITYGATGLVNIPLKNGTEFEKPEDENTKYIYLGKNLESIPLGTEFEQTAFYKSEDDNRPKEKTIKLIVKGYIKDGSRIVNDEVIVREKDIEDYYFELDNLFVCVSNDDNMKSESAFLNFNIKDGYDIENVMDDMNEIAKKSDINLVFSNYKEAFRSRESKNMRIYSYIIQIAVIILVTVVVLQICMQSMNVINNAGNYGVMYANGVSRDDLRKIIILQNIIKYISSLLGASILLIILYVLYGGFDDKTVMKEFIYCIKHFVLIKTILISFFIMIIGTVIPISIIERMSPIQLIKSK